MRSSVCPLPLPDSPAKRPHHLPPSPHTTRRNHVHTPAVGDQKQLAPTCISPEAAKSGLARSLFERMALAAPSMAAIQFSLLTIQYRMHPLLRAFPSAMFYSGKLEDGVRASDRAPPAAFPSVMLKEGVGSEASRGAGADGVEAADSGRCAAPPMKSPLAFLDVPDGREESGRNGVSKLNRREAAIIATVAKRLIRVGIAPDLEWDSDSDAVSEREHVVQPIDVGIITPYAAQVVEIRRALRALGIPREVEVRTVDGFQGREKEIILFSCVRANRAGRVGFLSDQRRLNVGLTRARRGLFICGSKRTLKSDPGWDAFLQHCEHVKCMLSSADLKAHGIELRKPSRMAAALDEPSDGEQEADVQSVSLPEMLDTHVLHDSMCQEADAASS